MRGSLEYHVLERDGRALHSARCGAGGTPLVLFHGVLRSWPTFLPLIPHFAWRMPIWALDHRGHGQSSDARDGACYRVVDYAEDAVDWLRQVVGQRVVVLGHSLGALVALAAAEQAPDRVEAVILEDPPFDTMGDRIRSSGFHDYFSAISEFAQSPLSVDLLSKRLAEVPTKHPRDGRPCLLGELRDPANLRFMASNLRRVDPRVFTTILDGSWLQGFDWRAQARGLPCPVLVLRSDPAAGGMLTREDAATLNRLAADVTLVEFPGAGHNLHASRTQDMVNVIISFLESLHLT